MAQTWCPATGDLAALIVDQGHTKFMDRGDDIYDLAISSLGELGSLQPPTYSFTIDFDFDGQLTPFQRPGKPTLDASAFAFMSPPSVGNAPGFTPSPLNFVSAPDLDIAAPSINLPPRPERPNIALPVAPPPPGAIEMPIEPDYVLPPVPTFEQLNLPAVPDIQIPEFTAQAPVWVEPPFNQDWSFEPAAYEKVLLDELHATLLPMLQAKRALPEAIEDAIFQKGRSRIEVETNRNVEQAMSEFAARGFAEPPGQLAGRVQEIRQGGSNQVAEFSRDAAIKQFEETLANLRFAITQGAALEGVFIQLHIEEQRFALQAATFQRESALAVLNARITVFNARQQAYATDAQVFESRLRASLAIIEVYRAQIEGERARGEINEQRVRLYEGLLRGVGVMADFYRNRIEAVKVRTDADRNLVERFKAEVDAYDSQLRAYSEEWRGYSSAADAEGKRADIYRALVDATTKKVDAWSTGERFKIDAERLRMDQHGQQLRVWEGGLSQFSALLDGERARLAAVGQYADAQARLYTADAAVEQAASAATDRSFQLGLERARANVDAQTKQVDLVITQMKGMFDQLIAIKEATARIGSQLTASAWSAVNYSAGLSSSHGVSSNCSSNFQFVGEIADA